MIQPVYGHPALRVDNVLVIADLHIGVESRLMKNGVHIPSRTDVIRNDILNIAGDSTRLVVLGDVKDSVPGSSKQEYREIPDLFQAMLERFDIVDVVIGNHDTGINDLLPSHVHVHPPSGIRIGNVGMVHGHTRPSSDVMGSDVLITAHNHPTVMLTDGVGRRTTEQCWFRAPFIDAPDGRDRPKELIMMPSFNRLLGGSPVNVDGEGFLGPIMNSDTVNMNEARIFLLDGIFLGKRKDLMTKKKL